MAVVVVVVVLAAAAAAAAAAAEGAIAIAVAGKGSLCGGGVGFFEVGVGKRVIIVLARSVGHLAVEPNQCSAVDLCSIVHTCVTDMIPCTL